MTPHGRRLVAGSLTESRRRHGHGRHRALDLPRSNGPHSQQHSSPSRSPTSSAVIGARGSSRSSRECCAWTLPRVPKLESRCRRRGTATARASSNFRLRRRPRVAFRGSRTTTWRRRHGPWVSSNRSPARAAHRESRPKRAHGGDWWRSGAHDLDQVLEGRAAAARGDDRELLELRRKSSTRGDEQGDTAYARRPRADEVSRGVFLGGSRGPGPRSPCSGCEGATWRRADFVGTAASTARRPSSGWRTA